MFTGIQAKKTRIITSDVDTIFRQISEAFGETFTDLSDGKKKEIDKFILVTINEFSEDAKDSLWASLRGVHLNKLVTCLDGNQLINIIDKYLPSAFWKEYDYYKGLRGIEWVIYISFSIQVSIFRRRYSSSLNP